MKIRDIFLKSLLLLFAFLFTGCLNLIDKNIFRYDLNIDKKSKTSISGKIIENQKSDKPYHLILLKIEDEVKKLVDFSSHTTHEKFHFNVIPGKYLLYAVQEPKLLTQKKVGHLFISEEIVITTTNNIMNINVTLSSMPVELKEYDKIIGSSNKRSVFEAIKYDKKIDLNDKIFNKNAIRLGLWRFSTFFDEIGGGVYAINNYAANKIPLLFVHGINGSPRNFSEIIESIDKNKFHILVYYYPTGANLNYTVDILKFTFDKLIKKYQHKQLYIIAHSMGGLVSRGFINVYQDKIDITKFITISTPWNGQKFAKLGGIDVGMFIPSFGNVYPGSAFQKKILQTKLPKTLQHHLIFGFYGKKSLVLDNSNDGVVSLSSQLHESVQKDAYKIYGFNLNHLNILFDDNVTELINDIINKENDK